MFWFSYHFNPCVGLVTSAGGAAQHIRSLHSENTESVHAPPTWLLELMLGGGWRLATGGYTKKLLINLAGFRHCPHGTRWARGMADNGVAAGAEGGEPVKTAKQLKKEAKKSAKMAKYSEKMAKQQGQATEEV